ncbi:MAG: tape measure protein [Candidatus Binatia bacterium]
MAVGRLVVELELRDGQFHGRMGRASADLRNFGNSLNHVDQRLGRIERGVSGTLPHLRDIAIVTSSLHSIFATAGDTIGVFAKSLIDANSEVERARVLLTGLSKSVDTEGKLTDAARDMKFLFDTAKEAPFSLKEISNSFVKMRTVGIDDVENKIRNLTDSIANFGGDDLSLHRATVAIQQMASKGVISMEELRQQLGEAVPNAMQMMADGMGMSMGSFIKSVSEGKVKAIPAIEGMMQQMELSVTGSSQRMMETWSGMVSQLQTNWMLLQKQVGDAGFFDAIKEELQTLNTFLQSDDALGYAQAIGDGLKSTIDAAHELNTTFQENKEIISDVAAALLSIYATTKAIAIASAGAAGAAGFAGAVGAQAAWATTRTNAIRNPTVATRRLSNWGENSLTGGINTTVTSQNMGRISHITEQTAAHTAAWKKGLAHVGTALGLLAGPIGLIGISIAMVAGQFIDFGNKAEEAIEGVIKKQEELNEKRVRVDGDAAISTEEELNKQKEALAELIKQHDELVKSRNTAMSWGDTTGAEWAGNRIMELNKKIFLESQAIEEGQAQLFERAMDRQKGAVDKTISKELAARTTQYKAEVDLINKGVDQMIKAHDKSTKEIDKIKHDAMVQINKDEVEAQEQMLEEQKQNAIKTLDDLRAKGSPVVRLIDYQKIEEDLTKTRARLRVEISDLQNQINALPDGVQKNELREKLTLKQGELDGTVTGIASINKEIDKIKSSSDLDWKEVLNFMDAKNTIDVVTDRLETLLGWKEKLNEGRLLGDDAMTSGNADKLAKEEMERAQQVYVTMKGKLASVAAEFLQTQSRTYDKLATYFGESVSKKLTEALEKAASDTTISEDLRLKLQNTLGLLGEESDPRNMPVEATADNYEEMADYIAEAIDSLKGEAAAKKLVTEATNEQKRAEQELAEIKKAYATGIDPVKIESERTVAIREQIAAKEKLGLIDKSLNEALAQSMLTDKIKAQVDAEKANYAEMERIKQQNRQDELDAEDFKLENTKKTHDDLLRAVMEYNQDVKGLYQLDTDNYVQTLKDQINERRMVLDQGVKDWVEARRKEYEAAKKYQVNAEAEKEFKQHNRNMRLDDIGRTTVGSNFQKDAAVELERFNQALADANDLSLTYEQRMIKIRIATEEYYNAIANLKIQHQTAFEEFMTTQIDFNQVAGDGAMMAINGVADGMAMLATEGAENFREFVASVLKGIAAMMIKMAALMVMQMALKAMGFADGGVAGGGVDDMYYAKDGGVLGGIRRFAAGGMNVKPASKAMMDGGGVKDKPHLALFAEAGVPEAFIPMPDRKNIPISVMQDENGNLSAKALLPGGRSIPAKIEESNLSQFAQGGALGALSGTQTSMSVQASLIDDFARALTSATVRVDQLFTQPKEGREPVAGQKFSAGENHIAISIEVNDSGGAKKNETGQGRDSDQLWSKMADNVKVVVLKTIAEQKRPGGALWRG